MKRTTARHGYAMLLVLAFLVIFFALLSLACSQLTSLVRAETFRAHEAIRDEGRVAALARGLALLETGYPPSTPYVCGTSVDTSRGTRDFTVTFTSQGGGNWSVNASPAQPNQIISPMPAVFVSQTPL